MEDSLTTVAEFDSAMEAGLAKARLEANGVQAFLSNETVGEYPSGAGAIALKVSESDLSRAIALLRGEEQEEEGIESPLDWREHEPDERCPVCEGSLVNTSRPAWPFRLLRLVLSMFLPLPDRAFATDRRSCGICGYSWRTGEFAVTGVPPPPTRP